MSENFESGLRDLYTRAASAHDGGAGFPTTAMVGTARHNRRVRAAGVSIMTVAAVVGVGFAGVGAVRTFGDGSLQPPAGTPTVAPAPTTAPATAELTCGTALADQPELFPAMSVEIQLDDETIAVGEPLDASVTIAVVDPPGPQVRTDMVGLVQYAAVQDGVVVGLGEPVLDDLATQELSGRQGVATRASISFTACEGGEALSVGAYDLYGSLPVNVAVDGTNVPALVGGGPWPFTIVGIDPDADTSGPVWETDYDSGHSAEAPDDGSLPDGYYIGTVSGIDAASGTIDADLLVFYSGQAAIDYLTANQPDAENPPPNDFITTDDGQPVRTLPLAPDAKIWDWCFGEVDLGYQQRTVAEWVEAPTDGTQQCGAGAALARNTEYTPYWLKIRDGVVAEMIGQYLP
jgi:hypothetical protein